MNEFVHSQASRVGDAKYLSRSPGRRSAGGTLVCLLAVYFIITQTPASGVTEVIATSGDPAPDGNSAFSDFGVPAFSAGLAAFEASLTGTSGGSTDNRGIFLAVGDTLTQIVRTGSAAPDGNGTFSNLLNPGLSLFGQVAFQASFTGTIGGTSDSFGIFRGDGEDSDGDGDEDLIRIARTGQSVPDGGKLSIIIDRPALNGLGKAAFKAHSTSGARMVFLGDGETLFQIVRTGQFTPDTFDTFVDFDPPVMNVIGQATFRATLTQGSGIYRGGDDGLVEIVRSDQPAPDADGVGNGRFSSFEFPAAAVNADGEVAFRAGLSGTVGGANDNAGVFLGNDAALSQIVRKGDVAPDGNGTFFAFGSPTLNGSGQIAFSATLTATNGGVNDNAGIFLSDGDQLTQVVRKGQSAPDGNGAFSFVDAPALDAFGLGVVAFRALLVGTSGVTTDNEGVFLAQGDEIIQVARKGDALAGSTITALAINSDVGANGDARSSLSFSGAQLAYRATLADGRQAIVRFSNLPDELLGDYNGDGVVNAADYVEWRNSLGETGIDLPADGSGDGEIDVEDYQLWRTKFGKTSPNDGSAHGVAVPEPSALLLAVMFAAGLLMFRYKTSRHESFLRRKHS